MRFQLQWIALVVTFVTAIAVSMGCATLAATAVVNSDDPDFYNKPALSDEIVAIGRPDAALAKELGQPNVVAFIGLKNTYLLHKGGEELERIAQLKLDGKRMDIDAARSNSLYLKDKQVWGELFLTYGGGSAISTEEISELEKGGFTPIKGMKDSQYKQTINIEGVIYPAIKLSDDLNSRLSVRRPFNLYNSRDSKPPMIGKILKLPLIAVGVAADNALMPVSLVPGLKVFLGFTTIIFGYLSLSQ